MVSNRARGVDWRLLCRPVVSVKRYEYFAVTQGCCGVKGTAGVAKLLPQLRDEPYRSLCQMAAARQPRGDWCLISAG